MKKDQRKRKNRDKKENGDHVDKAFDNIFFHAIIFFLNGNNAGVACVIACYRVTFNYLYSTKYSLVKSVMRLVSSIPRRLG